MIFVDVHVMAPRTHLCRRVFYEDKDVSEICGIDINIRRTTAVGTLSNDVISAEMAMRILINFVALPGILSQLVLIIIPGDWLKPGLQCNKRLRSKD